MSQITDDKARAAIRHWVDAMHAELDRSSYYHLLQLGPDAYEEQIRAAYYTLVARLHPDLYVETLDVHTREKLVSIYSRLVEGYRVLSDGAKREVYNRGLAAGKLRYSPEEERVAPRKEQGSEISNPNAKRFFKLGQEALRLGNGKAAVMNLKFALQAEPASALIKAELERAEKLVKSQGGGS
jgi:curved DNA-binding protein CbpA